MQILSANLLHTQRSASSDNRFRYLPSTLKGKQENIDVG